jgi:hypothetical protein
MRIKELSKSALAVFRVLTADIHKVGDHVKIDNTNGGFMPVVVEGVGTTPAGCIIVSVAHYYEQNGDLMADPEVTFCVTRDNYVFPMSHRQDGLGVDREYVRFEDGHVYANLKMQNDLAVFCNQWMRNIKEQQFGGKLSKVASANAATQEAFRF